MIISASRRTDLPAYYSDWLLRRLSEGRVLVRNPMNSAQVREVDLSREAVDALVIWTKNPLPLMSMLDALKPYACCFLFTLTSYGKDIEPGIPSKNGELIPTFIRLAGEFGAKSLVWRYDPILINEKYTPEYHVKYFSTIAKKLRGHTARCVISFMDFYRCTQKQARALGIRELPDSEKLELAQKLCNAAMENGMEVFACAEELDLGPAGIPPASCIDARLLSQIAGKDISAAKDKNQRKACGCAASVDIGAYDTCLGGCGYCYATHSAARSLSNAKAHDPASPFLIP